MMRAPELPAEGQKRRPNPPPPRRATAGETWASSALGGALHAPFHRGKGGPGGWFLLHEPRLRLHGDSLVPPLAAWRRARWSERSSSGDVELVPDWLCEVLSPATTGRQRAEELAMYARAHVLHAWLVAPAAQSLEAYRLENGQCRLLGLWQRNDYVRVEPFETFELELGSLWSS